MKMLEAGLKAEDFDDDGCLTLDFEEMATEYFVRCVPGSLVELEDEKQLRILNQMFIPLSQAMPAMGALQDQQMLQQAAKAMQYIIGKQIELSGSASAKDIGLLWKGETDLVDERDKKIGALEESINGFNEAQDIQLEMTSAAVAQLQEQMSMMAQNQQLLLEKLGVVKQPSENGSPNGAGNAQPPAENPPAEATVYPASA